MTCPTLPLIARVPHRSRPRPKCRVSKVSIIKKRSDDNQKCPRGQEEGQKQSQRKLEGKDPAKTRRYRHSGSMLTRETGSSKAKRH